MSVLPGVSGSRSGQGRKLDTAANWVDALSADADAVAEFPDMLGPRTAARFSHAAGTGSGGTCVTGTAAVSLAATAATSRNDCMIALAVKNLLAGQFLDAREGHDALS